MSLQEKRRIREYDSDRARAVKYVAQLDVINDFVSKLQSNILTLKNTNDLDHDDFEHGFNFQAEDEDLSLMGRNYQSYMKYLNVLELQSGDTGQLEKFDCIKLKTQGFIYD